jgi:rhamnogalacturonyl hydrolase YesR
MHNLFYVALFCLAGSLFSCTDANKDYRWAENAVNIANAQLRTLIHAAEKDSTTLPRSVKNDQLFSENIYGWTSGFFAGNLWYASELTGDKYFEQQAEKYTAVLHDLKHYRGTHDLGFMVYCSYGNAYRITKNDEILPILIETAGSLASRYSDTTQTIRSWDHGAWSYPVIIDNMMNLELLFFASKFSGNPRYKNIAIAHADATIRNHFRDDFSSYHVVSYDPATGAVESRGTHQGYAGESAWARGQAWGLYGFTMCYRETQKVDYLETAEKIAAFLMNHPHTPADKIPYWDYNAPDIPAAPRDASAAAIIASALLELSTLVKDGAAYFNYAEEILKNLSSDAYLAEKGSNHGFILRHSVGHLPARSEIDTPLIYADYYYLEGLKRYLELKKIKYPF